MKQEWSQGGLSALTFCPSVHPQALNISDHYSVEVELSRAAHKIQPLSLATLLLPLLLLPFLPPQMGLVA